MKKKIYSMLIFFTLINIIAQHSSGQTPIPYRIGNKWGIVDMNGKQIVPVIYDSVEVWQKSFISREYTLIRNYKLFGFKKSVKLDLGFYDGNPDHQKNYSEVYSHSKGSVMEPPTAADSHSLLDGSYRLNETRYRVQIDGKMAIANQNEFLMSDYYDWIGFNMNLSSFKLAVKNSNKYGILDIRDGSMYIPLEYDSVFVFSDQYNVVIKDNKSGLYYLDQLFTEIKYDQIKPFQAMQQTFFIYKEKGKYGVMDSLLKDVIHPIYDIVVTDKNYTLWVQQNKKWALFNFKGTPLTGFKYDFIKASNNKKIYFIKMGNKWGMVNSSGKEIFKPQFDDEPDMEWDGYDEAPPELRTDKLVWKVQINGKTGYVDYTGKKYWKDK